jgi:hypothetical protein
MPIAIGYMSDLHNEFERGYGSARPEREWFSLKQSRTLIPNHPSIGPVLDGLRNANLDLMVLAGDIDVGEEAVAYTDKVALYLGVPVILVMGNHEAYGGRDLDLLIPEFRSAARATNGRVMFLENEVVTFDLPDGRLHALGCTLWTDYQLLGSAETAMSKAANGLNDHRRIFLRGRLLSPERAREIHQESLDWLRRSVAHIRSTEGAEAKILIVTHHAPHQDGSAPQFRTGDLAPAFATDLTAEIRDWRPVAWIFGHTHHSCQIDVDDIPVVSAQRGYLGSEAGAADFVPAVIEI